MSHRPISDWEKEQERLQAALRAQFDAAALVELTGVIGASGPTGGMFGGGPEWTMMLNLEAWRVDAGVLRKKPLVVRREMSRAEFDTYRGTAAPYSARRLRVKLVERSVLGRSDALLVEDLGDAPPDPEIQSFLNAKRTPVKIKDDVLGTLKFDRRTGSFESKIAIDGGTVRIRLCSDSEIAVRKLIPLAREIAASWQAWRTRACDVAVAGLYELANTTWRDDDAAEISEDAFRAALVVTSVSIEEDGEVALWFDDVDMFGGHAIEVRGTVQGGLTEAHLAG